MSSFRTRCRTLVLASRLVAAPVADGLFSRRSIGQGSISARILVGLWSRRWAYRRRWPAPRAPVWGNLRSRAIHERGPVALRRRCRWTYFLFAFRFPGELHFLGRRIRRRRARARPLGLQRSCRHRAASWRAVRGKRPCIRRPPMYASNAGRVESIRIRPAPSGSAARRTDARQGRGHRPTGRPLRLRIWPMTMSAVG